jgi:hypothetical protein
MPLKITILIKHKTLIFFYLCLNILHILLKFFICKLNRRIWIILYSCSLSLLGTQTFLFFELTLDFNFLKRIFNLLTKSEILSNQIMNIFFLVLKRSIYLILWYISAEARNKAFFFAERNELAYGIYEVALGFLILSRGKFSSFTQGLRYFG